MKAITALDEPLIVWRFAAYKSKKRHKKKEHYFVRDFLSFQEMKNFSSQHSLEDKQLGKYPKYVSIYWKIEICPSAILTYGLLRSGKREKHKQKMH